MLGMNKVFQAVRTKVSADKHRYQLGGYDLDLTYITERIIGPPSSPHFTILLMIIVIITFRCRN
jgi:hypothetical protein